MTSRSVLDIRPRDADAPGYFDLRLDTNKVLVQLRGEPCLDRLCRKLVMSRSEVIEHYTPGTYVDPNTNQTELNASYDPGFDEGLLESLIWNIVRKEVSKMVAHRHREATFFRPVMPDGSGEKATGVSSAGSLETTSGEPS